MINILQGLGYGIIAFAVLLGIGVTVLGQLGSTVASCPAVGGVSSTYNSSSGLCTNSTGGTGNPSTATQTLYTINNTYIATNLVSWLPVIIVLVIGMLFLGAFMAKKGRQS
jgi:hypothetical protein